MVLRGAQIRRCGHDTCGLLPVHPLSRNLAELPPFGLLALIPMSVCAPAHGVIAASNREVQHMVVSWHRQSVHVTRARCRMVRRPRAELPDPKGGCYVVPLQRH